MPNPIDFAKVESLRRHMLLRNKDMAELMGVTRMTYYGWLKGKPLRNKNDAKVRSTLRLMLVLLTEHGWPEPQVIAMSPDDRYAELLRLIEEVTRPEEAEEETEEE
jgi:DNA-binding XRE family transcriptional regulator